MGNRGIGVIEVLLIAVSIAAAVTGIVSGNYVVAALGVAILSLFAILATM